MQNSAQRKRCSIVTLDAKLLLSRLGLPFLDGEATALHWAGSGDDVGIVESDIVLKTSEERPNALLDQIQSCVPDRELDRNPVYSCGGVITKWLVFVDFSSLFMQGGLGKGENDERETAFDSAAKILVDQGFRIEDMQGGPNAIWHYSIFDKSANQARNSTVSFIADAVDSEESDEPVCILGELDERLRLGIDFAQTKAEWSKYYAYRGLYLSSGRRIPRGALRLDEEMVIVLPSISGRADGELPKTSGVLRATDDGQEWGRELADEFRSEAKLFDGEGLVVPEYAHIIRDCLGRQNASTFQIRMPFTKGLLHEVDFHRFMKDELGIGAGSKLRVTDAFGKERDLSKAKIVLTAEMLKCLGWLKEWVYGNVAATADPMRYYFRRFAAGDHALYVSNTNAGLDQANIISLNAQFLSTFCMSQERFDSFVQSKMDEAVNALDDPIAARNLLMKGYAGDDDGAQNEDAFPGDSFEGGNEDEEPSEERDVENDVRPDSAGDGRLVWRRALAKSIRFIDDPFIKSEIPQAVSRKLLKCAIGELDVAGTLLYLSHDLLRLLIELATNANEHSGFSAQRRGDVDRRLREIGESGIGPFRFYAPSIAGKRISGETVFGILRNPHLSRSEQCAARQHNDAAGLYQDYFGHLSGIMMVGCASATPMALGGADFDGDIVQVLWEEAVVDAILDGSFEHTEDGVLRRRFPVVDMERPEGDAENEKPGETSEADPAGSIGKHITYEQLKRTFSNHIGMISNSAMRQAREAYGMPANADYSAARRLETNEDGCALYSFATGMEIDAVKTGEDLTDKLKSISKRANKYSDKRERLGYIEFKKGGYRYLSQKQKPLLSPSGEQEQPSLVKPYKLKREQRKEWGKTWTELGLYYDAKKCVTAFDYSEREQISAVLSDASIANIDRLSWLFLQTLEKHAGEARGTADAAYDDDDWLSDDWLSDNLLPIPTDDGLFTFEGERGWPNQFGEENAERIFEIEKMLGSYRCVITWKKRMQSEQRKLRERNDFAKACRIVRRDPRATVADRANCGASLRLALSELEAYFYGRDASALDEAITRLRSEDYSGWAFLRPAERCGYLGAFVMPGFEPSPLLRDIVLDGAQRDSYMILFYLLRSAQRNRDMRTGFKERYRTEAEEARRKIQADSKTKMDDWLLVKLIDITNECLQEKRPWAEWNDRVVEAFRARLQTVLGLEEPASLVMYLRYLQVRPRSDGSKRYFVDKPDERKLFWSLLKWEEVEGYIAEEDSVHADNIEVRHA